MSEKQYFHFFTQLNQNSYSSHKEFNDQKQFIFRVALKQKIAILRHS